MNTDTDADVFDPFLSLIKNSQVFDEDDITCPEVRKAHQKHVNTRLDMDKTLRETKQFLLQRLHILQRFEETVPEHTRHSPAYKHFFETFTQKQVMIQHKYNDLLEKREAVYGKYISPIPSPQASSPAPHQHESSNPGNSDTSSASSASSVSSAPFASSASELDDVPSMSFTGTSGSTELRSV